MSVARGAGAAPIAVAKNGAMLVTLMFVAPAREAAASVVPMLLTLVTLMFVSPGLAGGASVVSPLTSPVFPLPGAAGFVFRFGPGCHVRPLSSVHCMRIRLPLPLLSYST